MRKRIAVGAACTFAVWLVLVVVLSFVLSDSQARGTAERLSESLQAQATIASNDLALLRGHQVLEGIAIRRDDTVGKLSLDVAEVRCELGPLGYALFDSTCSELRVRGTRLEVSTTAVFKLNPPKHSPVHANHVIIDDAVVGFAPSALVPDLGRIEIVVDHAEAGETVFRTPLSWLLSLRSLRAHLNLPAGISLRLGYDGRLFSVAGTLFGSSPVAIPVTFPPASSAADAQAEIQLLVASGKDIAQRVVAKRAEDWVRSYVH